MGKFFIQIILAILGVEMVAQPVLAADPLNTGGQRTLVDVAQEADQKKTESVKDRYKPRPKQEKKTEDKTTEPPKTEGESKTAEAEKKSDTPAIGRHQEPLDELVITPPELPRVTVRLPTEQETTDDLQEDMTSAYTGRIPRTNPVIVDPFPKGQQNLAPSVPVVKTPAQPKQPQLYDVSTFAIAGLKLGITPLEAVQNLTQRGFVVQQVGWGMPPYYTQHYTRLCRKKYFRPDEVQACVRTMATQNQTSYVSWIKAENGQTHEALKVLFTSHATENILYKLYYEVKGDPASGWGLKAMARKNEYKEGFWDLIFALYGYPDDSHKMIWGDPQHAFMQATVAGSAYNGYIVLLDRDLAAEDYFAAEERYHQVLKPAFRNLTIGQPLPEDD